MSTFYSFAFGFDILNPGGTQDTMAFQLRQQAQATKPRQIRPDHAEDLAKVSTALMARPAIAAQTLPELICTIAVLSRMLADADRPADLHCTVITKEWLETEWDPDDDTPITVQRFGTKTKKTSWLTFQIKPIQEADLRRGLGASRDRASDLVNHCCLARAWKTYICMVKPCLCSRLTVRNFKGRRIYAQSALVYGRTNLTSSKPPRFLSVDRLTNIIKDFHVKHVGPLPVGTKHVTYWWRHYVLSTLYAIGEVEAALSASDHKNIRTFLRSYELPPNPDFMERWQQVRKRAKFGALPPLTKLLL